jgi:hypothetical protein
VTVSEDAAPAKANSLPLAPFGITSGKGYLEYRVYLPAGGDFSKVAPPALTLEQGGQSQALPPCPARTPGPSAPPSTSTPTAATGTPSPGAKSPRIGQLQFYNEVFEAATPNADAAYVLAYLSPPGPDDVVVIRARAPKSVQGEHPVPWPAAGLDMRYWSMCVGVATATLPTVVNALPSGGTDPGCRADSQTKLDAAGDYWYVLGTEAQRSAIEGAAGATFLPFSAAQPHAYHVLLFREIMAIPGYANSPLKVTSNFDPAATAAAMGPSYPRGTVCPLSKLISAGVSGCFG